jgi:uncharacterized protein YydD (DUF2326 family)
MPLWEQVKSNLVEWYSVAADKTEELAKIGVRRYDKFGISRDIERQFTELGSFVYNALNEQRRDFLADPTLLAIVERIKVLEQDLRAKENEIEDIKAAHQQRSARTERAGAAAEVVYPEPAGGPPAGAPEPDPSAGEGNPEDRD